MPTKFNIQLEVNNIISTFTPLIPTLRYEDEDGTIPRISISNSIEGCLTAAPWGGRKLEHMLTEFSDYNNNSENEYCLVFRVYEFDSEDIKEGNLLSTEELLHKGLVMDANASNEEWVINQELKPVRTYLIVLDGYDEGFTDTFTKEYYQLPDDAEDDEDFDIEDYMIGTPTIIKNAEYQVYEKLEDIPFEIEIEEWDIRCRELREDSYES